MTLKISTNLNNFWKINRLSTFFNSILTRQTCYEAYVTVLGLNYKSPCFIKQNLKNNENLKVLYLAQRWLKIF